MGIAEQIAQHVGVKAFHESLAVQRSASMIEICCVFEHRVLCFSHALDIVVVCYGVVHNIGRKPRVLGVFSHCRRVLIAEPDSSKESPLSVLFRTLLLLACFTPPAAPVVILVHEITRLLIFGRPRSGIHDREFVGSVETGFDHVVLASVRVSI
jgi:hypothetical protein